MGRRHWYMPDDVNGFEGFHLRPYNYFTQTAGAMSRLGMNDPTKGWGREFDTTIPLLIQEYQQALAYYRSLAGHDEQHAAHEILMQKQHALGDEWNKLRNYVNSHPDHTIADNDGSGLPADVGKDEEPSDAPVMEDSYPVVDKVVDNAADKVKMTYHDSDDGEKSHKRPAGQLGMRARCLLTKTSDPVPTRDEVIAAGTIILSRHSPFRHDFGADHQGWRLSYVTCWVNNNNEEGRYGELISIILS